jgi:hypothetical protein
MKQDVQMVKANLKLSCFTNRKINKSEIEIKLT